MSDREAVLFANEAFYTAFAHSDIGAMENLWAARHPVSCFHPGWEALTGRQAVLESWQAILSGGPASVRCHPIEVVIKGEAASVLCFEIFPDTVLLATNLFVFEDGAWRLSHHHAGPTQNVPLDEIRQAGQYDDVAH